MTNENVRGLEIRVAEGMQRAEERGVPVLEAIGEDVVADGAGAASARVTEPPPAEAGGIAERFAAMYRRLGSVSAAAEAVGISRAHAYRLMKKGTGTPEG